MKHYLLFVAIFLLAGVCLAADPATRSAGDYVEKVGEVSFVMKAIPAGTFSMGCGIEDEPCADEEWASKAAGQRQRVESVDAFYLAETETTWALYQLCIDAGACPDNEADGGDNGWGKGTRPVIEVSWNQVTESFLPWLNRKTGKSYRLPNEVEWEYAARAGTRTRYSWGHDIDCDQARYGFVSKECGTVASTEPVKSYAPNAWGLYDMHGNVWEFVSDCWRGGPQSRAVGAESPATEALCVEAVLRGGSWLNAPKNLRSSARFKHDRTYRESGDGFRVAHSVR
ncbi:MAG: formylglycine-generating enzyme family protein [Acidobacteriota bacterium]